MPKTIDFYKRDRKGDGPFFVATLVIDAEGKTTITGEDNVQQILRQEIDEGFPGPNGRMFPSDTKEYVERLVGRYSGSRFWARVRRKGDNPEEFLETSADPEFQVLATEFGLDIEKSRAFRGVTQSTNGHFHEFLVLITRDGIIRGRTLFDGTGHIHLIKEKDTTEEAEGHAHRVMIS